MANFKCIWILSLCFLTQAHKIRKRDDTEQNSQFLRTPQKYIIEPIQTLTKASNTVEAPSYDPVNFAEDNEIVSKQGEDLNSENMDGVSQVVTEGIINLNSESNLDDDKSTIKTSIKSLRKLPINSFENAEDVMAKSTENNTNTQSDLSKDSIVDNSEKVLNHHSQPTFLAKEEKLNKTSLETMDEEKVQSPSKEMEKDSSLFLNNISTTESASLSTLQTPLANSLENQTLSSALTNPLKTKSNITISDTERETLESDVTSAISITSTTQSTENATETVSFITEKPIPAAVQPSSTKKPSRPTRPTRRPRPSRKPTSQKPRPPVDLRPPSWFPNFSLLPPNPLLPTFFINPFNATTTTTTNNINPAQSTYGFGFFAIPWNWRPLNNLTNFFNPSRFLESRPPLSDQHTTSPETRDLSFWNALFHGDYKALSSGLYKQSTPTQDNKTEAADTPQSNWKPWSFKFPKFNFVNDETDEPVTIPANTQILHVYFPLKYPFRGQIVQTPAKNIEAKNEVQSITEKVETVTKKSTKPSAPPHALSTTEKSTTDLVNVKVENVIPTKASRKSTNEKASLMFELEMPKSVIQIFKGVVDTFMPSQN